MLKIVRVWAKVNSTLIGIQYYLHMTVINKYPKSDQLSM
jgi:hypothetical protein